MESRELGQYICTVHTLGMPPADDLRLANWLGALTVAAADAQAEAMACGRRDADVAAILTLREFPGTTVGDLARVLGLSSSAAVRVADRVCADGLATRGPLGAGDARQVALALTPRGAVEARRLQRRRLRALDAMLEPLAAGERRQLGGLLDRMLRAQPRHREAARHICRYCTHSSCRGSSCPVGSSVDDRRDHAQAAGR